MTVQSANERLDQVLAAMKRAADEYRTEVAKVDADRGLNQDGKAEWRRHHAEVRDRKLARLRDQATEAREDAARAAQAYRRRSNPPSEAASRRVERMVGQGVPVNVIVEAAVEAGDRDVLRAVRAELPFLHAGAKNRPDMAPLADAIDHAELGLLQGEERSKLEAVRRAESAGDRVEATLRYANSSNVAGADRIRYAYAMGGADQ